MVACQPSPVIPAEQGGREDPQPEPGTKAGQQGHQRKSGGEMRKILRIV
jgi:hypothetical protein